MPPSQPASPLKNPFEQKRDEILNFVNEARQKEFNAALEVVCKTTEGRFILSEVFRHFHLYDTPHDGHGATTSFQCGQQSVCFRIRDWMRGAGIYMDYWPQIEKDAMERNQRWEDLQTSKIDEITKSPVKV